MGVKLENNLPEPLSISGTESFVVVVKCSVTAPVEFRPCEWETGSAWEPQGSDQIHLLLPHRGGWFAG